MRVFCLLVAVFAGNTLLFGQRASITGRITDASGAVVVGARVTATGAENGT